MRYIEMRRIRMDGIDSRGQAIVELALVLFLLLLLVLGIFEFGRAMYIKNTLTHAARAGARAAVVTSGISSSGPVSINTSCNYGTNPTGNPRVFEAVCKSLYSGIDKNYVNCEITIADLNNNAVIPDPGDMVTVKVTLTNFGSVVPNFIPVPSTLSGDTAMRYE
jgi:Flp pilus assembly protein TadG